MKKRILSILLCLSMAVSLLAGIALAEEPSVEDVPVMESAEPIAAAPVEAPAGSTPVMAETASMSYSEYQAKYTAFINDSRWKDGTAWDDEQRPKLSGWGAKGCCAYEVDFTYYVFGITGHGADSGERDPRNIRAGDTIYINWPSGGGHWIVILERDGNTLKTAEGNWADKVHISTNSCYISGSTLYVNSYSTVAVTIGALYHHDIESDSFSPEKPVITAMKETYYNGESITFNWNECKNATHYNFWLYQENESGTWEAYEHSYSVERGFSRELPVGRYRALIQSYNSNYWNADHSDWLYCESDYVYFDVITSQLESEQERSAAATMYIYDQGAGSHSANGSNISITHIGVSGKTMFSSGCSLYATLHAFQWLTGYKVTDANAEETIRLFLKDENGGPEVLDWYNENHGHSTGIDFLVSNGVTLTSASTSNKSQLVDLFARGGAAKFYTPNGTHFAVAVGLVDADIDGDGTTETWIHVIDSAAYFSFGSSENMAGSCRTFASHAALSLSSLENNGNRTENNRAGLEYWLKYDLFKSCTITKAMLPPSGTSAEIVSFASWVNDKYTYIYDTDAGIGQDITVSGGTSTETGMYLYDQNGNYLAKGVNNFWRQHVFFKAVEECGYTLTPGTTYKYKFYAVVNGETYWSEMQSFRTTGNSATEYKVKTGVYYIINKATGKYLYVNGGGDSNGTNVLLGDFTGAKNQQWEITQSTTTGNNTVMIRPLHIDSGRVLNCNANTVVDGSNVDLWQNTGNLSQRWGLEATNDGYVIHCAQIGDLVADEDENGNCLMRTFNGNTSQTWILVDTTHTHSYTEQITTAATCTAKGVKTFTCTCGDSYTEEIAALGHAWSAEKQVIQEATTTETGLKAYVCTREGCDATKDKETIPVIVPVDPTAPTLTVANAKGRAGKTVDVTLDLSNNPGIAGGILSLSYAPELTVQKLTVGNALNSLTFTQPGDLTENPLSLLWDGMDADTTNGTILTITFAIPEGTEEGDYAVTVTHKPDGVYNADLEDVILTVLNGKVTVKNVLVGDVNGDETINAKDVTVLRRYLAGGYGTTVDDAAADVNGDGTVNAKDVTVLRRFLAGGYGVVLD